MTFIIFMLRMLSVSFIFLALVTIVNFLPWIDDAIHADSTDQKIWEFLWWIKVTAISGNLLILAWLLDRIASVVEWFVKSVIGEEE